MKIAYITAGAGGMICGNCLRDNALAAALLELGHDVQLIPTYTPIRTDEEDVSLGRVFYGGINVYLQQKYSLFRRTPGFLDRLLDHRRLLRFASRFAVKTAPRDLGSLTVSVVEGSDGPHKKELDRLIEWLGRSRPEVVHLTNTLLAGMAPAVKGQLGIPVCCSLQGEDFFLSNLPAPHKERAFELVRHMAASVDAFIAPCRDHAEAMAPHLGISADVIHVVLPGISLDGFSSKPDAVRGEFVVGYLARICPEKGLHLLAEALRRLTRKRGSSGPRLRLRVAGWLGPEHRHYLDRIRQQVKEWGSEGDFEYLGSVGREQKLRFLSGLDALSVPVTYRAPKGLYVLEAMASGVPVVQPRLGVFPELIETTGGGLLFEPGSVEDLAGSLERLIDDRAEGQRMGQRGRQAVHERFHSRRVAEETLAVYETL